MVQLKIVASNYLRAERPWRTAYHLSEVFDEVRRFGKCIPFFVINYCLPVLKAMQLSLKKNFPHLLFLNSLLQYALV